MGLDMMEMAPNGWCVCGGHGCIRCKSHIQTINEVINDFQEGTADIDDYEAYGDYQTTVEGDLQEALRRSDEDNKRLRRANSKLKGEARHLRRVIRSYKEALEQAATKKPKFRNRNHQGGRRR